MRFFDLNEKSYTKYFIEDNEFSIRKPIKVIKNDGWVNLIDILNPFYYLSMSLFLCFELIDKLIATLVSDFTSIEKKQEDNPVAYLVLLSVNLIIAAVGFAFILAPTLIAALLVPLPVIFVSGLPLSFGMAAFCFSLNCLYWSKYFLGTDNSKGNKKSTVFSELTINFKDFARKKKEDCKLVREGLKQLEHDEQAYINSCKQKYPEYINEFNELLSSEHSNYKEDIEHTYNLKKLYELLCTYPSFPEMKENEYTTEVLQDYMSDATEHHDQLMTLFPIVLEQGYERLNLTKKEEVSVSSFFTV